MTGLLEKALRRVEILSAEEQDAIVSQIIETLDDEVPWATRFRRLPAALRDLARAATEEHRRGEARPLDELHRVKSSTTRQDVPRTAGARTGCSSKIAA